MTLYQSKEESRKFIKLFHLNIDQMNKLKMCKKCPYSELFWSVISRIRTEYGGILRIFPYLVQMRENKDQNNSEYGHFSRSA